MNYQDEEEGHRGGSVAGSKNKKYAYQEVSYSDDNGSGDDEEQPLRKPLLSKNSGVYHKVVSKEESN